MSGSQKGGAYARALARELPRSMAIFGNRFATRTPNLRGGR